MSNESGITLVMLSYNEIDGTKFLIDKIPFDQVDEFFVVDGGSTDGTREFLTEKNIPIVDQESKGRGEAFRIAFQTAKYDRVVFFSLDGNEDTNDIPKFKQYFDEGYGMVIASRMCEGATNEEDKDLIKIRKWANNIFNLFVNIIWNRSGTYVTDSINGFRGFTKEAWKEIRPDGAGYTIEYQSTIRCFKKRVKIKEFPTMEHQRVGGESYAHSIPTGLRFLKLLWSEILRGNRF